MRKILIADDHEVVRYGLRQLPADKSNEIVIGEATTGQEVLERVGEQPCDVVLLDIEGPTLSVKTVSTYGTRILTKMNMPTNAELIHYAISEKLVD
jgi:DNA-binding NarL/FixJ family response regulator